MPPLSKGTGSVEEALRRALAALKQAVKAMADADERSKPPRREPADPTSDDERLTRAGFQRLGEISGYFLVKRVEADHGEEVKRGPKAAETTAAAAPLHHDSIHLLYEEVRDTYTRVFALQAEVGLPAADSG